MWITSCRWNDENRARIGESRETYATLWNCFGLHNKGNKFLWSHFWKFSKFTNSSSILIISTTWCYSHHCLLPPHSLLNWLANNWCSYLSILLLEFQSIFFLSGIIIFLINSLNMILAPFKMVGLKYPYKLVHIYIHWS